MTVKDPHAHAIDFDLVNDEKHGVYAARAGDTEIAGIPYNVTSDGRIVLLSTSVYPQYRGQGVGTELIRRVLDDVRTQGKRVDARCPTVRAFVEHNPDYADLFDAARSTPTEGTP